MVVPFIPVTNEGSDLSAALEARWRLRFALGIGLSLLLVLGALGLGWRELQVRRQQSATQAELVIDGVERQLRERLGLLREELAEYAAFRESGDVQGQEALQGAELRFPALRALRFTEPPPGAGPSAAAPPGAAGLQMLPPEPGARVLRVVWTGTPGDRVEADLDPQWFAGLLQGHALADGAVLNLVHESGRMYARSGDNLRHLGRALREAALFAPEHRSRRAGRYEEESVIGGEPKLFVYRRVAGTPLAIVVGTPRETVLAPAIGFLFVLLAVALPLAAIWVWLFRAFETGRRQQARLLQEVQDKRQRLREAQALAAVGSWSWNPGTGEVHFSDEACALYGLAPTQAPKSIEAVWPLIHPDDVGRLQAMAKVKGAQAGAEAPAQAEFRIRRADGAMRWIHVRAEIVYRDGQRLAQGTVQDITAIAAMRERLRLAQGIARIGDWEWDVASSRIHWSRTMYEIYGRNPATFTPHADNVFDLIHPADRERVRGYAQALLEQGEPCAAEFRIVRGDGAVRTISTRGLRDVSADGRDIVRSVQQDITELAQARDALAEAERQYRYLFEHNPVPMWVFDRDSLGFLAVNDATVRYYGYTREELLQRSILDIRPQADRARVEAEVADTAAARRQGQVWTHLRKDGSALRAAIFTEDIRFGDRPARLVAAQDVTEREASEQRFRLVTRATSDAVYDYDIGAGTLWWSDSFYATFGYGRDLPATIDAWEALIHPDDAADVGESLAAALADPAAEEWEGEYRLRRRDGEYALVIDRGFFVRDGVGAATRMLGGMLDVSERRRREADLRLLSRAIESVDNGVAIADARAPDLPLVYVNQAFEAITGYTAAEVIGRNCRFLQAGERDQVGAETIRQAIADRHEARALLRNYRKDGSVFWNELHVAPVLDERGQVSHYVGIQNDVSHRHRYEQELAHRATHDQLTGLPNRELLHDRLQQAVYNAGRYGRKAAVMFLDLDDFKLVNDNLDHAAGDRVLRAVAERLRAQVRETDTVGRFGGDEFVVLLTEQDDEDGVGQVIERINQALAQPIEIDGGQHVLTASIGWCRFPEAGSDPETLLKHADMAMYQAKRGGRNRAVRYDPAFDARASQRLQLVGQLRLALERGEFVLAFQPIYDSDARVQALECLVRWQHPERGLLAPAEFISVCEETGLILELGRRVLREAGRHHRLLAERGLGHLRLAVNVSPLQFNHALEQEVAAVLAEFDLPAGVLELEITEGTIMENPEQAIASMHQLSAQGVCLAVDDFGTGYSSLAYLKRLPLNRVKIDRSFVQDLPHDQESASICASIIGLAQSLGLGTVAEGVETAAQLRWLRENGCDELQGFLLARPVLFDEVVGRLAQAAAFATP